MLIGRVNRLQARLAVEILTSDGWYLSVEVVLDTGFSGELTLPSSVIRQMDLISLGNRYAHLATGEEVKLPAWRGIILWDGRPSSVEIIEADGESLLGMGLLVGSRVAIDVREGGVVTVDALP